MANKKATNKITLVEAVTQALAWELENDESVVCFGQDIGPNGG
ncbi:MAG: alpha-ketoacid dehydrogenase subunit beta, partial [Gammaproteobacteria bacterium]